MINGLFSEFNKGRIDIRDCNLILFSAQENLKFIFKLFYLYKFSLRSAEYCAVDLTKDIINKSQENKPYQSQKGDKSVEYKKNQGLL